MYLSVLLKVLSLFMLILKSYSHSNECKRKSEENLTTSCSDRNSEAEKEFKNRYVQIVSDAPQTDAPQYDAQQNDIGLQQSHASESASPQRNALQNDGLQNHAPQSTPLLNNAPKEQRRSGELPKGNLQPFGESGNRIPITEIEGFPSDHGQNFFLNHLLTSRPVLMKGAATRSPSFHKWTDDYLLRVSSLQENRNVKVEVEAGKKENREDDALSMRFDEFLSGYNVSDWYLVEDVHPWMKPLSFMPCPLQCPQMKDVTMKFVVWFSSGGTKSVVHTDGIENINCLYRGNKTLVMIDPATISTGTVIDKLEGAYSGLDVDEVDLNRYPTLRGAQFIIADMEPGDCLYIPQKWIHQVRSFGSNVAINVWFHGRGTRELLNKGHCTGNDVACDPTFTLGRVPHPQLIEDDNTQGEGQYLLRRFFEYSSIHGKAAIPPDNHPMRKGDERVRLEGFIQEFIEHNLESIVDRFRHGSPITNKESRNSEKVDRRVETFGNNDNDIRGYGNVNEKDEKNKKFGSSGYVFHEDNITYDYDGHIDDSENKKEMNDGKRDGDIRSASNSFDKDEKSDDNQDENNSYKEYKDGYSFGYFEGDGYRSMNGNVQDDDDYDVDDEEDDNGVGGVETKTFKRIVWHIRDVIRRLDTDSDGVLTSSELDEGIVDTWAAIVGAVEGIRL